MAMAEDHGVATDQRDRRSAIELRAYYLYLDRERAGEAGDSVTDWCRAEEEEMEAGHAGRSGEEAVAAHEAGNADDSRPSRAVTRPKPARSVRAAPGALTGIAPDVGGVPHRDRPPAE